MFNNKPPISYHDENIVLVLSKTYWKYISSPNVYDFEFKVNFSYCEFLVVIVFSQKNYKIHEKNKYLLTNH
jgi:hypothetical protein